MKRLFLFFATLLFGYFAYGQTVENIQVEPDGNSIKITYRIGGSTDAQMYNVTLTCSMDGGPRFEPQSTQGDVRNNIRGGRSYYTIIWDVFKDVNEVGSAEFFVKVDLISDSSVPVSTPQNQPVQERVQEPTPAYPDFDAIESQKDEIDWRAYLAYSGSTLNPIGLSFGTLKNVGAYGSFRFNSDSNEWLTYFWFNVTAGLTKHIWQRGIYRLHVYGGAGALVEYYDDYTYDVVLTETYLTIDGGINNVIGRINVNLGLEFVRYWGIYPSFGLGFAF